MALAFIKMCIANINNLAPHVIPNLSGPFCKIVCEFSLVQSGLLYEIVGP